MNTGKTQVQNEEEIKKEEKEPKEEIKKEIE